jgi:SAM-dependent methyltransferase
VTYRSLLSISDLPCHFGPMPTPDNFAGLPNILPFELAIDTSIGILRQIPSDELRTVLDRAYQHGNMLGTPLIDDEFGAAYVNDFLEFLDRSAIKGRRGLRILEVGAGAGFITYRLRQAGHDVTAIEPGSSYAPYWERYGIDVLNTFFPTPQAPGPYDLIISYAVLEHIEDAPAFLQTMAGHLAPGGLIAAAVPNDTDEIVSGDPGMLVHEHYYYFTDSAFHQLLEAGGLAIRSVEEAQHTRVLFGLATGGPSETSGDPAKELELYDRYTQRFTAFRSAVRSALDENIRSGRTLGIYCPARALAVLPADVNARFFDDASYNKGRYFPPFPIIVEGREDLFRMPVDELWIMSRSFADVIGSRVAAATTNAIVRKIDEFN